MILEAVMLDIKPGLSATLRLCVKSIHILIQQRQYISLLFATALSWDQ